MKNILNCVTIGDPEGIGLELIFNIWKIYKNTTGFFFIIGDYNIIKKKQKKLQTNINLKKINSVNEVKLVKFLFRALLED